MTTSSRGFDSSIHIPVGAQLVDARWAVPSHYSSGDEFATQADAVRAAITVRQRQIDEHVTAGRKREDLPQSITVDLRWKMQWSVDPKVGGTSGIDTVVLRVTYDTLDEAHGFLDRVAKYSLDTAPTQPDTSKA